ncbi:energy transducer TonB [Deferribacter abyssi]|uniref:energy transducer TonB n=1 Tax=Deferribacter abyssi TaxID=213806 RepID=UPI003C1752CC
MVTITEVGLNKKTKKSISSQNPESDIQEESVKIQKKLKNKEKMKTNIKKKKIKSKKEEKNVFRQKLIENNSKNIKNTESPESKFANKDEKNDKDNIARSQSNTVGDSYKELVGDVQLANNNSNKNVKQISVNPKKSISNNDNWIMEYSNYVRKYICEKIKYPGIARRRGIEGKIVVEFYINTTGSVININLLESSGFSILDNAVLSFLEKTKFEKKPKKQLYFKLPIQFSLKN